MFGCGIVWPWISCAMRLSTLGDMPSNWAWLLAFHITSQITAPNRINSGSTSLERDKRVWINWSGELRFQHSGLRPQRLLNQIAHTKGHFVKRWRLLSSSTLHSGEMESPISKNMPSRSFVGRTFAATLHKCVFSLSWIFVFQIRPRIESWLEVGLHYNKSNKQVLPWSHLSL